MTSCLLLASSLPTVLTLEADLEAAGIHVVGAVQRSNLVQELARLEPDLVVVHEPVVDEELLQLVASVQTMLPRPVILFTDDADAATMQRALDAGVHAYVVKGYASARLRSLVHLAQARFAQERKLREELADVASRFEERKLVDRAKGLLMRARQLSEDDAFKLLRVASMHSNRRVGQVSQQVIASASLAEAVNRAGQLRMLSQRVLKLHGLAALEVDSEPLAPSFERVDANLAALTKALSPATYGDLLQAVAAPWSVLKGRLLAPLDASGLAEADALAERMLLQADRLVAALEATGAASTLHVINVAGRQRMLSQRVAAQAVLAVLLGGEGADRAAAQSQQAQREFAQALDYLETAPLTTREIRQSLDEASRSWAVLTRAAARMREADGPPLLAQASEALLELFEGLTDRYEHSMQVLIG